MDEKHTPGLKHAIRNRWTDAVIFECEVPADMESGLRTRFALEKAVAAGANLSRANLADANLSRAYLAGAYLADAYLAGAYLADADLARANLARAYLADADLARANLARAYLSGAYLAGANLAGANLAGANLAGANLDVSPATPEQAIANLDKVREIILDDTGRLQMGHWHGDDEWRDRTCAEETLCGTTHCLAGWLQVCSTDQKVRDMPASTAGMVMAPVASRLFYSDSDTVLNWLRDRKYVQEIEAAKEKADAAPSGTTPDSGQMIGAAAQDAGYTVALSIDDVRLVHAIVAAHRRRGKPAAHILATLAGITRTLELLARRAEADGSATLRITAGTAQADTADPARSLPQAGT